MLPAVEKYLSEHADADAIIKYYLKITATAEYFLLRVNQNSKEL
jgi:hypothetical protein